MLPRRAAVVTLLLLGACRPTPPPPPLSPPPPGARAFLVREAQLENGPVSVHVEIPLAPAGPKPTVVSLLGDSRPLLAAGFVVATYQIHWALLKGEAAPPPPEGAGVGKWVLAAPSAASLGEGYLRQIAATATEHVPRVLDYLATVPEIDVRRIGMAGGSTNGFVALQAAAADRRIRAVVALAACGDYRTFLRDSSMGMEGRPLALAPAYEAWIRNEELIEHPQRVVHAAVLMRDRVRDPLIPIACADRTARVLEAAYARAGVSERFRYERLEEEGHGIDQDDSRATVAWLVQWLMPGPA
ncbi:MAG TPA: hypothetical protein VKZ18_15840 [Polyangia bacterium]|nr:hypothetical protein [Polyangia bacterium]